MFGLNHLISKGLEEAGAETLKVGASLRIRIPHDFTVADGPPLVKMEGRLTRFDPSTKTRVPVTQEWVDEAVAEIVRLNQEIEGQKSIASAHAALNTASLNAWGSEVDRIWEAVRAASAV